MKTPRNWRAVPGWPGYYATSRGAIVSLKGKRPRRLKLSCYPAGSHLHVRLSKPGGPRGGTWQWVHRLVAAAFHRPPRRGEVCRHLNGDRQDNRPDNLRWGAPGENATDTLYHGRGYGSKLTPVDVRAIRARAELEFQTPAEMAAEFGVTITQIRRIINRRAWAWLSED